jgi:ribonucleoside-diphosphate reductase alpha chain
MHREALGRINWLNFPAELCSAVAGAWDECVASGTEHGYRNAQVTVLAPTGTIAFMMDCDTTGIEPDLALAKYKRLVGGGLIKIVNKVVPIALLKLGYNISKQRRSSITSIGTARSKVRRTLRKSTSESSIARSSRPMAGGQSITWGTSG